MPPSDQEPRYRLVDSNGNVVGALWGDGNGNVKIADETDTQTTFGPDGISTPALEAGQANTTKGLTRDYTQNWPHPISRGPEISGPPSLQPHPDASNPIITGSDVDDFSATAVADPFFAYDDGSVYIFFEVLDGSTGDQTNAVAVYTGGVLNYLGTIAQVSEMSSWPQPRKIAGEWYMTPSPDPSSGLNFEIWKADNFPTSWSRVEQNTLNTDVIDCSPFFWDGRWYLTARKSGTLETVLYYDDSGLGPTEITGGNWVEHPSSPIFTTDDKGIPAGRPDVHDGFIDLHQQDRAIDGTAVRVIRATELSTSAFSASEVDSSPIVKPAQTGGVDGDFWNSRIVHHADVLRPKDGPAMAVVDGRQTLNDPSDWAIGLYQPTSNPKPKAKIYLGGSSGRTLTSNSDTPANLNRKDHDYTQSYDEQNYVYTVSDSGLYEIEFIARITGLSDGTVVRPKIKINGGSIVYQSDYTSQGSFFTEAPLSQQKRLSKGDTIEFSVHHNEGSDVTLEPSSNQVNTRAKINRIQ